jgi:spore coat assembly protein
VILLFKIGDLVTRISHKNDIIFRIEAINEDIVYLKGISVRLCADSYISDLVLVDKNIKDEDRYFYDTLESLRNFERNDYFYRLFYILYKHIIFYCFPSIQSTVRLQIL